MPDETRGSIIDGKAISAEYRAELKAETAKLKEANPDFAPGLAIVQIGDRDDSNRYIKHKLAAAEEIGITANHYKLPRTSTIQEALNKISELNNDPKVHGIIVQMPPESDVPMNQDTLANAVIPSKDVDGLHVYNAGKLARGELDSCFIPCTPKGCMVLLERSGVKVEGKRAVVVGRSKIVGAPMSDLLRGHHATVTVCHSRTQLLPSVVAEADILVVAIGKALLVKRDWVKEGAVVIDCGINFIEDASTKSGRRLVGDVDFQDVKEVASQITPVPGGVGPMTVAMLMSNTLEGAKRELSNAKNVSS